MSSPDTPEARAHASPTVKAVEQPRAAPVEEAMTEAQVVAAACELLERDPGAAPVPGTREYLCKGKAPTCTARDEQSCRKLPLCFARSGSGSGPNCSPCTPDWVFYGCEPYPKASLAKQALQKPPCVASEGTWKGSCDCGAKALFVAQRGCVTVARLCSEAGGDWIGETPGPDGTTPTGGPYCRKDGQVHAITVSQ